MYAFYKVKLGTNIPFRKCFIGLNFQVEFYVPKFRDLHFTVVKLLQSFSCKTVFAHIRKYYIHFDHILFITINYYNLYYINTGSIL